MKEFFTNLYVKLCVIKTRAIVSIEHRVKNVTEEEKNIYKKCLLGGLCLIGVAVILSIVSPDLFANYSPNIGNVQTEFKSKFNQLYNTMFVIATPMAVTLVAYNLIVIMSSKNQKKCDTAYTWIKAIIITWICFVAVGFVIDIAVYLFDNMRTQVKNRGDALFTY